MCYPSPPHQKLMQLRKKVKLGLEIAYTCGRKAFGENISNMVQCRNKYDIKLLIGHVLTDKMIIDLNVLSASM